MPVREYNKKNQLENSICNCIKVNRGKEDISTRFHNLFNELQYVK